MCTSTTEQSKIQTPSLPTLYFDTHKPSTQQTQQHHQQQQPSLNTLPPELLHRCLTQYADWGDLAKLACVQSSWKNLVRDAAEFGGRDAMWELSMCFLHGGEQEATEETEGAVSDNEEALEESCQDQTEQNAIENDNQEQQVQMVTKEYSKTNSNRGLQKNEALAVKYLTQLSGLQIDESQFPTTISTDTEKDQPAIFPHDFQKLHLQKTSSNPIDEAALIQLSQCYLHGTGLPSPNASLALHYLQSAYHLTNSISSAHTLALMYEYPHHSNNLIPTEIYAAFEWFRAAAEGGHVPSMAELALCYELGCGVTQSDELALDWYMKAAQKGHGGAHFSVGEAYEEARGVPMDVEEACLWYFRAASLGEEDGKMALRRLRDVAVRVIPEVEGILHE